MNGLQLVEGWGQPPCQCREAASCAKAGGLLKVQQLFATEVTVNKGISQVSVYSIYKPLCEEGEDLNPAV